MSWANLEPFLKLPKAAQWGLLVALSVLFAALLEMARLPAALLLGPMIAAIIIETGGARVKVPPLPFLCAQAVIGCMVAHVISSDILARFGRQWPLFLAIVLLIIGTSGLLGVAIGKLGLLPGTTAIWGLLPGAATVMMLMAEAFGADSRLVAFMQYVRVVCVAIAASLVARLWMHVSGHVPATIWFPAIHWRPFGESLAVILFGVVVGRRVKFPAAVLLLPMIVGAALQDAKLIQIELPPWFLALSYLIVGWSIGLRFTREILRHATRALPQTIFLVVLMIGFCGLLAGLLVRFTGVDPLTAYLATSPGGADSVAIIAASSKVDVPFVMSLQIARFLLIILIGPPLSRWLASFFAKPSEPDLETTSPS